MIAYMVLLAGVGLLCSTLAARNRSASFRMTIALIVYVALPKYCHWYLSFFGTTKLVFYDVFEWIGESCVFFQVTEILTSGVEVTVFSRQVITNLCLGAVGFLLSWDGPIGIPQRRTTRGVSRNRGFAEQLPAVSAVRRTVWKEFHFGTGGFVSS